MSVLSLALMPARLAVATAEVVLAARDLAAPTGPLRREGGYGERLDILLAEEGAIEQLGRLGAPDGPLARIEELAVLTADDQPLGRALAAGGPLDRLLADGGLVEQALVPGGPVEQLLAEDGPLTRLGELPDTLSRLADLDETLHRLGALEETLRTLGELGDSLQRLATVADALERLAQASESLPQLPDRVRALEAQLSRLEPMLDVLGSSAASLKDSAEQLSGAVVPLGRIVERLPGGRRRALAD